MPGPQKTKGALRNTRFKARMKRHNTTHKRKAAFYIQELSRKRQLEYIELVAKFALYISRKLEREGKIKSVETCDGSFETYYNADDSWEITQELIKKMTRQQEVTRLAEREFRQVRRTQPGMRFSLAVLILLLFTSWGRTADAKWNEFSSPPGEISAWDASSAAMIGTGIITIAGSSIFPPLAGVGVNMITCGLYTRQAGSAHRLLNAATGKHPMGTADVVTEAFGALVPAGASLSRAFVSSAPLPPGYEVTFERTGPTLGENITPALAGPIQGIVDAVENLTGKPMNPQEKGELVQETAEAAQRAIEIGIEAAPLAGMMAQQRVEAAAELNANMKSGKLLKNYEAMASKFGFKPPAGPPVPTP
jgi:hypothetical protein